MSTYITDIPWDEQGVFRSRPNRFLGYVDIPELSLEEEMIHIHDPGRLTELLYPGNDVLLKREEKASRKTGWDLIAARWEDSWILVHSGYHRKITESLLSNSRISPFGRYRDLRSEVTIGKSRIDFLLTKEDGTQVLIEVKGCTLTRDGVALFPDAPTERGRRHLETLIGAVRGRKVSGGGGRKEEEEGMVTTGEGIMTRGEGMVEGMVTTREGIVTTGGRMVTTGQGMATQREGNAVGGDSMIHPNEVSKPWDRGMKAAVIILVFRSDSNYFRPNNATDPRFTDTFRNARREGVEVHPLVFEYRDCRIHYIREIPVSDSG